MINFTTGVLDIINNPMSHGFGAGIQQNTTTIKAKQTIPQKNTIQSIIKENTVNTSSTTAIDNETHSLDALVNEILNTSIEQKLRNDIKTGKLSLKQNKLDQTYATAVEYYKKIYDNSLSIAELRNKTEKKIAALINKRINNKINSFQNNISGVEKNILLKSKLAQSLRATAYKEIHTAIGSLVSNTMISSINNTLLQNLTNISSNINATINLRFKSNVESLIKLRSIVQEKIATFTQLKQQYEKKISDMVQSLTNKIGEAMQQFTQKLVNSLSGSVQSLNFGIKLT